MKQTVIEAMVVGFVVSILLGIGFLFGDLHGWDRYYKREKTDECKRMKVNDEKFIPSYCYDYLK